MPKLHLSPQVEAVVGGASTLVLPSVPPGTCLMDYVEMVLRLLEERVRRAVMSFETRKQFMAEVMFILLLLLYSIQVCGGWSY